MITISKNQLFCLFMLFELGSTTIFALGIDAKRDAWIVILTSTLLAFALLWVYTQIYKYFPGKNFIEIVIELLGKPIGIPVAIIYILFYFYTCCRNLRDFGELAIMTFLPETPLVAIHIIFVLTAIITIFFGLEVLARTSEVLWPVVLISIIGIYIMVAITGQMDVSELTPILADGVMPVLKQVYPHLINFPFGETNVFLMLWCYVDAQKDIRKTTFWGIGFSGLVLTISLFMIVSLLGFEYASVATIPLLEVIKLINIGNIITNLDTIGVVIIFVGIFFKMIVWFFATALGISTLFKLKDYRWLGIPVGILALWYSIIFASSYPYHIWQGPKVSTPYILDPIQLYIPVFLLIICYLKKGITKFN